MNTFQLDCFLTVVETLNFARAAEQLNITQPAVTHQIRGLEDELNAKLFNRTTRSVELTSAGALFIGDARELLSVFIKAKRRFEFPEGQIIHEFAIGGYSYMQLFMLPEVIERLISSYPTLHPRIEIVPFQHIYRMLEEEKVDAVVGFEKPKTNKTAQIYHELMRVPLSCICSSKHPLAQKKSVALEDLKGEKLVIITPPKCSPQVADLQRTLMADSMPSDLYICDTIETALIFVQAGLGIALFPNLVLSSASVPDLITGVPIEGVETISFGIYRRFNRKSEFMSSFIHLMQEYFKIHYPDLCS